MAAKSDDGSPWRMAAWIDVDSNLVNDRITVVSEYQGQRLDLFFVLVVLVVQGAV